MHINFKNVLAGIGTGAVVLVSIVFGIVVPAYFSTYDSGSTEQQSLGETSVDSSVVLACGYTGAQWSSFNQPNQVAFSHFTNSNKQTWTANTGDKSVLVLDIAGGGSPAVRVTKYVDEFGQFKGTLVDPRGIAVSNDLQGGTEEYVFVSDFGAGKVFQFKSNLIDVPGGKAFEFVNEWAYSGFKPTKIVKLVNELAVVDNNKIVWKIKPTDPNLITFITAGEGLTKISGITSNLNYVFITESAPVNKLHRFNIGGGGKITNQPRKDGAELKNPTDVAFDSATNRLFVSNQPGAGGNNSILIFSLGLDFISNYEIVFNGEEITKDILSMSFGPDGYLYITTSSGYIRKLGVNNCASLSVTKDYVDFSLNGLGKSTKVFDFNITGNPVNPKFKDFVLDDNPNSLDIYKKKFFSVPKGSFQKITELNVDPDSVVYVCRYPYRINYGTGFFEFRGKGNTVNLEIKGPNAQQKNGDTNVDCVFYNYDKENIPKNNALITIVKDFIPGQNSKDFNFDIFSLNNPSIFQTFALDDDSDRTLPAVKNIEVAGGYTYSLQEVPAAGIQSSVSCKFYKYDPITKTSDRSKEIRPEVKGVKNVINITPKENELAYCVYLNCSSGADGCEGGGGDGLGDTNQDVYDAVYGNKEFVD